MFTAAFAKAAFERAVKTFAQTLAALLVADGTDILGTAWADRLSVAGMAAVVSLLTSVASGPFGATGPSLANEATVPPAVDPDDGGHVDLAVVLVAFAAAIVTLAAWLIFG